MRLVPEGAWPATVGAVREAGWPVVLLAPAAVLGLIVLELAFLLDGARTVARITGGLVQPPILFNLAHLLLVVGGVVFLVGGLRPRDVGLRRAALPMGVLVTAVAWLLPQALSAGILLVQGLTPGLDPAWTETGATTLGVLLGQLAGNAPAEEAVFRGFLLPQLYLKLGGDRTRPSAGRLLAALVLSQAAFALTHLPARLHEEMTGLLLWESLAAAFLSGLLFALLWLRTGNLFVAVGIHALLNYPLPLVEALVPPKTVILWLGLFLVAVGPRLAGVGAPGDAAGVGPRRS